MVEVMVALVVCMIIFSLSLGILLKLEKDYSTFLKLKSDLIHKNGIPELNEDFFNDTVIVKGLKIHKTISAYENAPGVGHVTIEVFSKNGVPLSAKQLLINLKEGE